jgi:hypothetical protein
MTVFGKKKQATEIERTCRRDGTTWYVQPTDIKKPKMAGWATPVVGGKRAALNADLALIEQRQQEAATCPSCGSSSFTEREVSV